MAKNIFNSVKGLHPRRNAFSALTYRNDFTAPLGVNIPCYIQHLPPATRIKVSCSALVRLQALFAPIMDNIDFYVHFWQMPNRLIIGDSFTKFISGEIKPDDYYESFLTPAFICSQIRAYLEGESLSPSEIISSFNEITGNGSLFDFLGYDSGLFPKLIATAESPYYAYDKEPNAVTQLNLRNVAMYFKLLYNWYMNENVQYYENESASFIDRMQSVLEDPFNASDLIVIICDFYAIYGHTLSPHAWEKDYFTSALPNVQYGTPVTLPISGTAPVSITYGSQEGSLQINADHSLHAFPMSPVNDVLLGEERTDPDTGLPYYTPIGIQDSVVTVRSESGTGVNLRGVADLSEASAISINELRFANALQIFKERQMRYGRRRQEYYKGFFDVTPEDLRLMLPKYLGGGRIPINISDIEQTSQTTKGEGGSAQGNLSGKATAVAGGFAGFNTFCSEESIIMGICFAMPHITYAQSISKFLLKTNDVYDYFNPSFEHLGEQPIQNIELYSGSDDPSGEFGYTPRYTEYRFHTNECHGDFKDTLSYWTLARIFDSQPSLSPEFIYMQPSVFNRIFAVNDSAPMLVSMIFKVRAIMPISKYGTPMLLS